MTTTNEGAFAFKNALNMCVEFFSKAGSMYDTPTKKPYYVTNTTTAKELFIAAFKEDPVTSLKLLFWLRDCRGGAGNRSGARSIITYLADNATELMKANMHLIPVHGRWDDMKSLFKTPLRNEAGEFWADAINGGDVLAAKWAKRHYTPIRLSMDLKESEFRRLLATIRKDHIVEHQMCQQQWNDIDFKKVPSVAMARYSKAFTKHVPEAFQAYKEAVKSGAATVHADVLFPHDCIKNARMGDGEMAELQFNSLPNYLEGTDEKIMVICDTSGSMQTVVGGSVQAIDVSQGIALYCSSRLPENSPFYKRFIAFCSESKFVDWRKHTFQSALRDRNVFNGAVGSTRIDKALNLILKTAKERNIPQNLMPTTLLIVSDMQFTEGACFSGGWDSHGLNKAEALTEIEKAMIAFEEAEYQRPKIVYWNLDGMDGQQATVNSENVGLVSGFSPSICKAIFGGEDFSPYAIMIRAIEKYKVFIPNKEGGVIEV